MFHENYVNSVKCFYYITKGGKNQYSHVVLGKELRKSKVIVKQKKNITEQSFYEVDLWSRNNTFQINTLV